MAEPSQHSLEPQSLLPAGLHRAPRILIVDPDAGTRKLLQFHLKRSGCEVLVAADGGGALERAEAAPAIDLVLLDLHLADPNGLETLAALNATGRVGCVIVMAGFGNMADAVTALRHGAYDFVSKTHSFDDVRMAVRNALQTIGLREELQQLRQQLEGREDAAGRVIGVSKAIQQVLKLVRKVTDSNITVLVTGESGTGKELIARAIHEQGQLRRQPFVALNCAAIPENLLESELFGHEKGAFTGATARRSGKFEEAHEGTLFLDEIGELSPALQAKLLRVLQTHEIEPIGGRTRRVNVRVVSATNQDLLRASQEGRFRADLYYRLAVFPIVLPPLRERPEDIPLLAEHFIERFAAEEGKNVQSAAADVMQRLQALPWYGNVRELENVVYRAVVLAEQPILTLDDFPNLPPPDALAAAAPPGNGGTAPAPAEPPSRSGAAEGVAPRSAGVPTAAPPAASPPPPADTGGTLEELEVAAIRRMLGETGGNMSRAAERLNIGRATLYRKVKRYGITPPR